MQKELAAVKKMQEFFEERIFGRKLFSCCEKVEGKRFQGEQIYRMIEDMVEGQLKKGNFFYLDKLHKNHLEVFEGGGKVKSIKIVLNFDGTQNTAKTIFARNRKRTLRID